MKKVIAWLLVLALTAAISIGATLAYLTDTDEDVNVMTLGKVKIDQLEYERVNDETANEKAEVQEFHDNKPLYPAVTENGFDYTPGDTYVDWTQIGKDGYTSPIWDPTKINNELDKMVFVKNKGDYDAYVRSVFAFEAGNYETLDEFQKMVHLNLNEKDYTWKWEQTPVTIGGSKYFVATATYNKVLAPGALTEISLSQIALDKTATNEDVEAFGDTYQILVKSQGIQADGFTDAATALNEGFGAIASDNIPWENDIIVVNGNIRDALHYLNGDVTGTKITEKVSKVVFGLTKDHAATVAGYEPYLVDDEQDVPVNAYYIRKGDLYEIYLLASSDIYLPKLSGRLMQGMTNLTAVDTTNLNTSRAVEMNHVFYLCSNLTDIDTSNFDFSSATTVKSMFNTCGSLTTLDVSNWSFPNATNMSYLFCYCPKLDGLDVSNWDVSAATDMSYMFYECKKLDGLDVSNWDVSAATNMSYIFYQCEKLSQLDVSDWDTSSATNMQALFKNCWSLEALDVSDWDVGNVQKFIGTFYDCNKLTELDVSDWDTSSATEMWTMFYGDYNLETLDVSDWDVSNVTDFGWMFSSLGQNTGDMKLKNLDVSGWDTSSATSVTCLFYGCGQLTDMDLSGWNTENLQNMSHMFADCHKLKSVNFTGWQTPKLNNMDGLFNHCMALETVDMSMFDTSNVTMFAQVFEICSSLKEIKGLENWNTAKGNDFSEMFSGCGNLKELDLSNFDTRNANKNPSGNWVFLRFMDSCTGLEKVTFGPYFSFDGIGTCPNGYKFVMPSATNVEGWDGKWYTADGTGYLPSAIPEETAATYYAVKPVNP